MATSVKMRERDKQRLDRLQGALMAREGRRVPQQALLAWLVDLGEAEEQRSTGDAARPMSPQEVTNLKKLVVRTGVRTREEEIDTVLARAHR